MGVHAERIGAEVTAYAPHLLSGVLAVQAVLVCWHPLPPILPSTQSSLPMPQIDPMSGF